MRMSLGQIYKQAKSLFMGDINSIIQDTMSEQRSTPYLKMDSFIRISSIPYLCPRQEAICALHKINRPEFIEAKTMVTFEFGHAFENIIRERAFGAKKILLGAWSCKNCGYIHGPANGHHTIDYRGEIEVKGFKRIPKPDVCTQTFDG